MDIWIAIIGIASGMLCFVLAVVWAFLYVMADMGNHSHFIIFAKTTVAMASLYLISLSAYFVWSFII